MTTEFKCAICGDEDFEDAVIYGLNPVTFRQATMHSDCFRDVYDDLPYQRSSDPVKFKNRKDEYDQRVQ